MGSVSAVVFKHLTMVAARQYIPCDDDYRGSGPVVSERQQVLRAADTIQKGFI